MQKLYDTCTVEGCNRPHKARGYCNTHYAQYCRGSEVKASIKSRVRDKPPECQEEGCTAPVKANGLCGTHYQRFLRHGHTRYRDRKRPAKQCSILGCDNHLYALRLCHAHYIKQRKWQAQGVSAERYQEMVAEQSHVCALCLKPEKHKAGLSGKPKDLAVDHCHTSGAVRGLLCSACNTALGLLSDDPALLRKAALYLEQHAQQPASQAADPVI